MKRASIDTYDELGLALDRLKGARDRGVNWLLSHIDKTGAPQDADIMNIWGRLPWALSVAGEIDTAAAVTAWAERSGQFAADGDYIGNASGDMLHSYWLSHYAIGTWIIGAGDHALRTIKAVQKYQDKLGGVALSSQPDVPYTDLMCTAQLGLAALMTGVDDVADMTYMWIEKMMAQQPTLDRGILYNFCIGDKLVTDVPNELAFNGFVDHNLPHQAYFYPGITVAFLAGYAQQRGGSKPLEMAEKLLRLNRNGTEKQFNDPSSVQICKYPWGISSLIQADPDRLDEWLHELLRMAHWFADWQNSDGSWSPSSFLTPEPTVANNMSKTAEHVMETCVMLQALGYAKAYK